MTTLARAKPGRKSIPVEGDPAETLHFFADRVRVYPKSVHGPVRRVKWAILIACLSIYYILPWIRWDRGPGEPDQALLLDIARRRFYFFDLEIWPQEVYYLTGLLIVAAVALFLVTSIAGRLWCGYTCPQTVWTDLFLWVERWIEGDRAERLRRDAGPMTAGKAARKLAKHAAWLLVAAATGGVWIMYYIDAPTLARQFVTGTASTEAYFFAGLFTVTTYLLAGWAREQVCTYMCPWPRFQSAMFDEQTITVTYQAWRGERRGPHKAGQPWDGRGDCIDCGQCVAACPTGIDIRDGAQLECIACGLCVDACNDIMRRIDRPAALITWDSLANQTALAASGGTAHAPRRFLRPRSLIYLAALGIVGAVMLTALVLRSDFSLTVERDRAPLFVRLSDGSIRNGYTIKVVNKSLSERAFTLRARGLDRASLVVAESGDAPSDTARLELKPDSVGVFRVLVHVGEPGAKSRPLGFILRDPATGHEASRDSVFLGP